MNNDLDAECGGVKDNVYRRRENDVVMYGGGGGKD